LSHFHHADILSATNVEFLQCSLLAGQYRYAARILGNDWPRPEKGMPIEKVIRYFYLRGMVHIGCDDFQVAIRCFWTALSIPCEAASVIAVDAWKKMVLAKMLVLQDSVPYQSLVALPSTAPNSLSRILTSSHAPESTAGDVTSLGISTYMNLAKLFHGCDRQGFSRIRQDKAALFEADHNTGLVERVASDMEHRRVFHLASVYMNIPLTQLAAELGVSEQGALNTLGQIHGLNFRQENGMIFFGVSQDTSMPTKDVERLMHLAACIRKLDVSLAGSSKYQSLKIEAGKPPRGVDDF
jgi:COP9 signalosome complex subunit 3